MLNDAKIKAAKPREAAYKLSDSGQLFLHVSTAGGRHWRMNYTFGKNAKGRPAQKTLTLGSYPQMTLVEARAKRDDAKRLLREGRDPAIERRVAVTAQSETHANTFEKVARRWHAVNLPRWSRVHAADIMNSFENDVFPHIGALPIASIKPPKVLETLARVEARDAIDTAKRIRQRMSAVFVFAISAGLSETDPAAIVRGALKPIVVRGEQPSIIDGHDDLDSRVRAVRQMLIDAEAERCRAVTKLALRFLALTAVRPGELRGARWDEMEDLEPRFGIKLGEEVQVNQPLWRIPAARMKGKLERKAEKGGDHLVPLSWQAVDVLQAMRKLTGQGALIFPNERHIHKPLSENAIGYLLNRAGYHHKHVPHGCRAAFSTIMNEKAKLEKHHEDRAIIDLMLAHVPKDKVEAAYNRADFMPRRREIAQEWADILLGDFWPAAIHLGQPIRFKAPSSGAKKAA